MTAKLIPIIDSPMEAGDQAVRDDIAAMVAAMVAAIDARIDLLETRLELKIEQLIAKRDEEGKRGRPP